MNPTQYLKLLARQPDKLARVMKQVRQRNAPNSSGAQCSMLLDSFELLPTMPTDSIKKSVFIVDDNPAVRSAVRGLFNPVSQFEVVGEAENGRDAIAKSERLRPHLIILDLSA